MPSLNAFSASKHRALFEDLRAGLDPSEGEFDSSLLKEARAKGNPQMGSTRYEPNSIVFEFIYPNPQGAAIIVSVRIASPERIVFMPVPAWVVETIWQGEIDGSYQFESDSYRLLEELRGRLEPDQNAELFQKKQATRRE
jgi:hypothetical protein